MGLLDDILLAPWFGPAISAIVLAALSAYLTLRGNIREKAWLVVYKEKRRAIRALIKNMDEFASTIITGTEVVSWETESLANQATRISFMVREKFGPEAEKRDLLAQAILDLLPTPSEMHANSPEVAARMTLARRALRNQLEMELQSRARRIWSLRTTLSLSVRNPDHLDLTRELLEWAYKEAHKTPETFRGVDADKFAEEWSRRMSPIKLSLRKDLNRSSLSLGAATRLSWRWIIKRSRTWKFLARASDRHPDAQKRRSRL